VCGEWLDPRIHLISGPAAPRCVFPSWGDKMDYGKTGTVTMQSIDIIVRDQDILGGTPVFQGTRFPFQALLDYLEGGQTLGEFLDDFPTVSKDAAVAALELAKTLLVGQLD
jgi:uncharacterized protein (DUF433 family)